MNVGGSSYSTLVRTPLTPPITSELWKGENLGLRLGVVWGLGWVVLSGEGLKNLSDGYECWGVKL